MRPFRRLHRSYQNKSQPPARILCPGLANFELRRYTAMPHLSLQSHQGLSEALRYRDQVWAVCVLPGLLSARQGAAFTAFSGGLLLSRLAAFPAEPHPPSRPPRLEAERIGRVARDPKAPISHAVKRDLSPGLKTGVSAKSVVASADEVRQRPRHKKGRQAHGARKGLCRSP